MPIYDYKCNNCNVVHELPTHSDSHSCPKCRSILTRYLGNQKFNFNFENMRTDSETSDWYNKFKEGKKAAGREDVGKKQF